jgi:hypothetical protein
MAFLPFNKIEVIEVEEEIERIELIEGDGKGRQMEGDEEKLKPRPD